MHLIIQKENFDGWLDYRRIMRLQFGLLNTTLTEKYRRKDDLCNHLAKWTKAWETKPQLEWVHLFFHTLDTIPMNWYLEMKLCHGIVKWDIVDLMF